MKHLLDVTNLPIYVPKAKIYYFVMKSYDSKRTNVSLGPCILYINDKSESSTRWFADHFAVNVWIGFVILLWTFRTTLPRVSLSKCGKVAQISLCYTRIQLSKTIVSRFITKNKDEFVTGAVGKHWLFIAC